MDAQTDPIPVHEPPIKVSVVVPTHNTGKTVLTGMHSLLSQTMPASDFEVVYVDDGSTDDTVDLLEDELAGRGAGPAVHILRSENSGWPGRPRNIGTNVARGEYVFYVDDDDWLGPEALERMYARAEETGADIVLGRMAGHGRRAPMAPFRKPVATADVRTDTTLLRAMTVHKFFRRSFLNEHGLRFPEGKVRLEDHIFTLRAYLLTDRIATVHDYTCYHWVRHNSGRHNISYGVEPNAQVDSIRKVLAILEAPETLVEDDDRRHRLAARWYGDKALHRLTGDLFLRESGELRDAWLDAVGALAADMPRQADAVLPTRLRIVAALARHGDRRSVEEHAEFESGLGNRPRVLSVDRHDGKLTVRCRTRLVRTGRAGHTDPVPFSRPQGRYVLELPPGVADVPGVAEAADFTGAVRRSTVRAVLHHRDGGTQLSLPTRSTLVTAPLAPRSSVRKLTTALGGRIRKAARQTPSRNLPRGTEQSALCYEAEFTVDPATADQGRQLASGTWDLKLRLDCGGWRLVGNLPDISVEVPEGRPGRR